MVTLEWGTIPFLLKTPKGDLVFNELIGSSGDGVLLLDETKCSAMPALRVVTDDVSQADGSILHDKWKSGYVARLGFQIWGADGADGSPACGEVLRELSDYIMLRLNSIVNPDQADVDTGKCRLLWTPSGYSDDRMLDRTELFEWPVPTYEGGGIVSVVFGLHTPLPYAMDKTQATKSIANGATETITNPGTSRYYPVFKVHGAVSSFAINNLTTGLSINYDAALPPATGGDIGGGDYAEISTFTNDVFLNGDSSNLAAFIEADSSEFFPLEPGVNAIEYTGDGGSCDVLWNPAWA